MSLDLKLRNAKKVNSELKRWFLMWLDMKY